MLFVGGVLAVLGILILLEGGFLIFNPKYVRKIGIKMFRNIKILRIFGVVEFIIGLLIIFIVFYL